MNDRNAGNENTIVSSPRSISNGVKKALLSLIILTPTLVSAAPETFDELAELIVNIINGGIGVALILGIVIYFYGMSTSLFDTAKGEMSSLRHHLIWGIIALFIMFSVWGITALLRNTLFGGGGPNFGGGGGGREQVLCTSLDDCTIE